MAVQGITKLPISIPNEQYISLLEKVATVSPKLAMLGEKSKTSLLSDHLINVLSLKESVESTRIEGTQVTFTEVVNKIHENEDWRRREVMNYNKALQIGYERIRNGEPLTTRLILELHKILMHKGRGTQGSAGEFRKIQNHIGPSNKIEEAVYIPIVASEIEEYMANWENFANGPHYGKKLSIEHLTKENHSVLDEDVHPLIKVAILHAQFESIHPFLDGNGRVGRIIIALFIAKEDITADPYFTISEELEKSRHKYYHLLNGVRGDSPDWYSWLNYFLEATERMAENLIQLLTSVEKIVLRGLNLCGNETQKNAYLYSAVKLNVTAKEISEQFNIHPSTARKALNSLADKKLLYKNLEKKRNVEYFNYDILDVLTR